MITRIASLSLRRLVAFAVVVVLATAARTAAQTVTEVLREVRVHGNYATSDEEIIRLAGLTLGEDLGPSALADARARLERSGRFVSVDVRKRYRSLDDPGDVAIVIIVQEHPTPATAPALGPLSRTFGGAMFMPILNFADGYGFTYGARVSFVDGLGKNARLSVPLTWGGTKRAAAEFERTIPGGPVDHVTAAVSLSRRTNPHFEIDEDRREVSVGASRKLTGWLRAGAEAAVGHVDFGDIGDRVTRYGAEMVVDTRADPVFPRDAVFASAKWEHLGFSGSSAANRVRLDARGYLGVIGQTVLSVRALYGHADTVLPPYERFLLGGAGSLRGYRTGTFAGDSVAAASVELRIPTTSPLSFARSGVDAFADVGAALDHGSSLRAASFHSGFGGGVFLLASIFQFHADIGIRRDGGVRLHVIAGVRF